jgi:hypothetical protein
LVKVPFWLSLLVTTTFAAPAAWAAVVAVIDVLLTTFTPVATVPPRLTVAPVRKPVPGMVTPVPPPAGPEVGVIELTVGAGAEPEPLRRAKLATDGTPLLLIRNSM